MWKQKPTHHNTRRLISIRIHSLGFTTVHRTFFSNTTIRMIQSVASFFTVQYHFCQEAAHLSILPAHSYCEISILYYFHKKQSRLNKRPSEECQAKPSNKKTYIKRKDILYHIL